MDTPTVGPIVGYTTPEQARIFIRGAADAENAVFAAIRYRKAGTLQWSAGLYSKLSGAYDMSDTLVLRGLSADTPYEYQAGWFKTTHLEHTPDTVKHLALEWPSTIYRFKSASPKRNRTHRYVVGSCRYLRLTLNTPSRPEVGDKIFAAISDLNTSTPLDGVLMIGDQVYVDDMNIFAPDREYADISRKYRAAFSQPHIRQLMGSTPTYMILDDHEIEDNWPANRSHQDDELYSNAIRAYETFQCSHGPAHDLLTDGRINRSVNKYWYTFADGDTDWFVMDCRTERVLTGTDRRMIGVEQEDALHKWVKNSTAKVKFIVSSVVFMPDQKSHGDDGWKSFAAQRLRLLEVIRANAVKNVIFVSGDIHGSLTCSLTHSEDPNFVVHGIVSSPLCNSKLLPYAKASNLLLNTPLASHGQGHYSPALTSAMVSEDNFACLTLSGQSLQVDFYNPRGRVLESVTIALK